MVHNPAYDRLLEQKYFAHILFSKDLAGRGLPIAIAYLNLNGFKTVNDTMGHDAGDAAIRAYFHDVAGALSDTADAYRLGYDGQQHLGFRDALPPRHRSPTRLPGRFYLRGPGSVRSA